MGTQRQTGFWERLRGGQNMSTPAVRHVEFTLAQDVQDIFTVEVRQRLHEMELAIAGGDALALGRAASSLQAVSSVVGAVETLAICCNIEFDAIAGRLADAARRMRQLHELWDENYESDWAKV